MVHLASGQVLQLVGRGEQQHELQGIAGEAVPLAVQASGQGEHEQMEEEELHSSL